VAGEAVSGAKERTGYVADCNFCVCWDRVEAFEDQFRASPFAVCVGEATVVEE